MRSLPNLPDWVTLEHKVASILSKQEQHGWYFTETPAWELTSTLHSELRDLEKTLRGRHPYYGGTTFTPRRNNRNKGYVEGGEFTVLKQLNPTSRDHIAWILQTYYGWKPIQMTATGKPVVDEVILTEIGSEIATTFARCLTVMKMLGMLSNGVNAWLKLSTKSRIHHHCSIATATHRAAHRRPNLAQVPHGDEYRALFAATPGLVMVGGDLSAIELRMLAHYLYPYDSGRYADILLNGDIHQVTADRINISRRQCKTVQYAYLYGAGDEKLGSSFDSGLSKDEAKKKGKELRASFVEAIPGLAQLQQAVKQKFYENKSLKAIDGRKITLDSPHSSLNYLLQSSAGVISRRWLLMTNESIEEQNIDAHQLAYIHDELQFECIPEQANLLKTTIETNAYTAGEYYKLRLPIAAEAKSGKNWSEVH